MLAPNMEERADMEIEAAGTAMIVEMRKGADLDVVRFKKQLRTLADIE